MEDQNENNEKLIKIIIGVVVGLLVIGGFTYLYISQTDSSSNSIDFSSNEAVDIDDDDDDDDVIVPNYSTPIDYVYSLSYLYKNAELYIKTIHRNGQLFFQLDITGFDKLSNNNGNNTITIHFEDKNGFKVTSYELKIGNLTGTVGDNGRFSYDGEIFLSVEDYALISDIYITSTIQPDETAEPKGDNIDNPINDSIGRDVLLRYYNNIGDGNLKEAYELSVKRSPYETFYGWFKDIEKAEINSIVPDPNKENWYLIDVNLIDTSGKSTNYSTNSRVGLDSSGVYRILETKIK